MRRAVLRAGRAEKYDCKIFPFLSSQVFLQAAGAESSRFPPSYSVIKILSTSGPSANIESKTMTIHDNSSIRKGKLRIVFPEL